MKRLITALAVILLTFAALGMTRSPQQVRSREGQLDFKKFTCREYVNLVAEDDGRSDVIDVWAHGYHSALHNLDFNQPVTGKMVEEYGKQLEQSCKANLEGLFLDVVKTTK